MEINTYIDHTILKADATVSDVKKICDEAKEYEFASVCINPANLEFAAGQLKGTGVKTCVVVGFPLGANTKAVKLFETEDCIKNGADEIDMVINVGFLKSGRTDEVCEEIREIKKVCGNRILKVIIETCYLTDEEKKTACELAVKAGADFVKTSTGFGTGGATEADVKLMKAAVGNKALVKASGGVRDFTTAMKMIESGASRLGTSNGIAIIKDRPAEAGSY
ncbi:MAG: deoxyribose-phosphate aldolase [Spirochaetes bacterium]|nr:deoxyribose-phosphate aldolase [Spirochaetota bacterium]